MTGDDPDPDRDRDADADPDRDRDADADAGSDGDGDPGPDREVEAETGAEAETDAETGAEAETALVLPEALRAAFKEPLGPVFTDAAALLAAAGRPVVAVGDVVTYHLLRAGHEPAVAVVDGRTKRRAVDAEVATVLGDRAAEVDADADADADGATSESDGEAPPADGERLDVRNEPGTVSRALVAALAEAVARPGPVTVRVDGEEDLATLPALLAAPPGAAVVYGQPDEGMVLVGVDDATRSRARALLSRMDGDADAVLAPLTAGDGAGESAVDSDAA